MTVAEYREARNRKAAKMMRLRQEGRSLQEVGDMFGVSRERVRQLIGNTGRILDNKYPPGYRRCYGCKKTLHESKFYSPKTNRCIACTKKHIRKWQKKTGYTDEITKGGKYYEHQKCRARTHYLIRTGKLKKGECRMQGPGCRGRIEAHHYAGYEHPELVHWYCSKHHRIVDPPKWGNKNKVLTSVG